MKKLYLNLFLFAVTMILIVNVVQASYLRNVPQKLIQPNGEIFHCYATGDEYYHWLHDEDGYTIIQDQKTGFYCYANLVNDELVASKYVVGRILPASVGLKPRINISAKKRQEIRQNFLSLEKEYLSQKGIKANAEQKVNTKGTINNIVIYIRFADESEYSTSQTTYTQYFNSTTADVLSQRNFFNEVSYNTLTLNTTFLPTNNGTNIISYQDSHTRNYFLKYNATTNPDGYQDSEKTSREHTLLQSAVNYVSSQVDAGLNIDTDNDGKVDNVCFIVQGSPAGWSDLIWPHMWSLYSKEAYINGKRVYSYNFQVQNSLDVSVLCHEMFHTLGAPDLYRYDDNTIDPVGSWDLMSNNLDIPQHPTQFMKWRYGKWIDNIPEITASGDYSLNPVTTKDNSCYKIKSPFSQTEYFVIEYRKKEKFDADLPGQGLLVYRINTNASGQGNASGPPDEVYVYRPNGSLTVNGSLNSAVFSSAVGRTSINDKTNPDPFLSTGGIGGLSISNISAPGQTISFHVDIFSPQTTDAGVNKIITPVSGVALTSAEKIKVMVSGLGTTTINSGLKINYKINNGTVVSEDFSTALAYGASVPFEFATTADLSKAGPYNIKVYTTLTGDQNNANDTCYASVSSIIPIEYLASLVSTTVGAYTELTSGTAIDVDASKDGLSSPISFPDGFTFSYCGESYTKFILSTNGFIKLGDQNPSSKSLYFNEQKVTATNGVLTGGIFNSTNVADNNIIAPFNFSLVPGNGGASYTMDISGSTPNRVVTIQFKNVHDDGTQLPNQYASMNFQIKLYENTNIIEFVYGQWTASTNTSDYRHALVGLRGLGNKPSQLVAVNKGSTMQWSQITIRNGNYEGTAALNFGNSNGASRPAPEVGRTIRFTPRQLNDIAVLDIYTLSQMPQVSASPHKIGAVIANYGTLKQNSVNVSLNIAGANTFSPASVVIPSIDPLDTVVVSFSDFTPSAQGDNTLTVSVANDDFASNNSLSKTNSVTSNTFCYADIAASPYSAYKGTFIAACKYHINGSAKIASVESFVYNATDLNGQSTTAYVLSSTGSIIGQSNPLTIASTHLGKWVSFAIKVPPTVTNSDFYVGLSCENSYFASYQVEKPVRSGAYFKLPTNGGTAVEFGNDARLMFKAVLSNITGIEEESANDISIYSDLQNIYLNIPELKVGARVHIYNIIGNEMLITNRLSQGLNKFSENFAPGVYIVKVYNGQKSCTQKVVIQ